ncbi:hypothetical protein H6P81_013088 [Aristolochia fimbriata]|uniref:Uncharacterized protein n=1 Tax=Aristolochia fimbriata TaxID=158543 RepID=A0AAV7EDP9_ARIFI|nr:hypothetical protein H6P81_013088 [Aristolochia fimbriata]
MTTGGIMGGSDFRSNSSEDDRPSYPSTCPHCFQSTCTCYSRLPASALSGNRVNQEKSSSATRTKWGFIVWALALFFLLPKLATMFFGSRDAPEQISVVKIQLGFPGTASTLQRDLNLIAETADTSSREGFNLVLKETLFALRRHQTYCLYGFSSVDIKENFEEGKKWFDQLFNEELQKIDNVTLLNVNGIKQSRGSDNPEAPNNGYIVVTVLVATKGVYESPDVIDGKVDLKELLENLGSVPPKINLAVQIIWTPQTEKDTLSRYEFLEKYLLLEQNSYDGSNIALFYNRKY